MDRTCPQKADRQHRYGILKMNFRRQEEAMQSKDHLKTDHGNREGDEPNLEGIRQESKILGAVEETSPCPVCLQAQQGLVR